MSKPNVTQEEALTLAKEKYGLSVVSVKDLPSYDDLNYHLVGEGETGWVLKVTLGGNEEALTLLDFEHHVMETLHNRGFSKCPKLVRTRDNESILTIAKDGIANNIRIITFVKGQTYAKTDRSFELLEDLGRVYGQMNTVLEKVDHPGCEMKNTLIWDLRNSLAVYDDVEHLSSEDRKSTVRSILDTFREQVLPKYGKELRIGCIHNDGNEYNILVDGEGKTVTAIIDFGDIVKSGMVNEVAIAVAYCVQQTDDPVDRAVAFIRAYCREFPLNDEERRCIHTLVATRLAVSVTLSAKNQKAHPENAEYLAISERPGWDLLGKWWPGNPDDFYAKIS